MTEAASVTRPRVAALTAFGALILATFCFVTSENLPAGLLPLIADDLHSSLSAVGLLVTGYGLTVAVVSVPLTRATRRIPRRYLLSGLLAVFVVASLGSTRSDRCVRCCSGHPTHRPRTPSASRFSTATARSPNAAI